MYRSDENHRLSFVPIVAQLGIQAALRSSTMMRSIHDPKTVLDGIVKSIFAGAAERLRLRGDGFSGQADLLEQASAHWLRHTAGSHMADGGADLRTVRDNLRHASPSRVRKHSTSFCRQGYPRSFSILPEIRRGSGRWRCRLWSLRTEQSLPIDAVFFFGFAMALFVGRVKVEVGARQRCDDSSSRPRANRRAHRPNYIAC